MGVGMIVCGAITDRLARTRGHPQVDDGDRLLARCRWSSSASRFSLHPGGAQLLLLAVGIFFAAGTTGPAGAMVANLTRESIRATAFGTLTLANNLLGLAAGPLVTGILADQFGLVDAMQIVPLAAVGALIALLLGRKRYPRSLAKVNAARQAAPDDATRPSSSCPGSGVTSRTTGRRGWPRRLPNARTVPPLGRHEPEPAGPRRPAGPDRRGRRRAGGPRGPQRRRPGHGALGRDVPRVEGRGGAAGHPAGPRRGAAAGVPVDPSSCATTAGCRSRAARCRSRASSPPAPTTRWATRCALRRHGPSAWGSR